MAIENSVIIANLLSCGEAQRQLRDVILRLGNKSEEFESDARFINSLSLSQTLRLEDHLKNAKRQSPLGVYLRKLAVERDQYRKRLFSVGGISESYWSEVLAGKKHPSKDLLFRIAIALKLSPDRAFELVKKAGYILSEDIVKDAVINWCLKEGIYDFDEIDDILTKNGLSPLIKYPS